METYSDWAKAFEIFAKYGDKVDVFADYDATDWIFVNIDASLVSEADKDTLKVLGWMVSDRYNIFSTQG